MSNITLIIGAVAIVAVIGSIFYIRSKHANTSNAGLNTGGGNKSGKPRQQRK